MGTKKHSALASGERETREKQPQGKVFDRVMPEIEPKQQNVNSDLDETLPSVDKQDALLRSSISAVEPIPQETSSLGYALAA